ncbi:MAG: hypothetical protein Q8O92_14150 [Candidatus Latescibacter sp.]|nr:hypothetical protein [Candidatus Latescibacter sp.]
MGKKMKNKIGRANKNELHRSSWRFGRLALILVTAGLVLIGIFIIYGSQKKPIELLPRTAVNSKIPINKVDPISGAPIVAGITSTFKGYVIGHCCTVSKRDWEILSPSQKDAKINEFL